MSDRDPGRRPPRHRSRPGGLHRAPRAVGRRRVRGGRPGAAGHRRARHRAGARRLPRPARAPARQDADARGVRRRAARRHDGAEHAGAQGHRRPHGLSRLRVRRRRRPGMAWCGRHRARAAADDVPDPALGAADGLGAVRHPAPRRRAGAVLRPAPPAPRADALAGRGLELRVGHRAGVPRLPRRRRALDPRHLGQPGQPGEAPAARAAHARVPAPVRGGVDSVDELVQVLRDGARRARPAAEVDRGRVRAEPARGDVRRRRRRCAPPTTWSCAAARSSSCALATATTRRSCRGPHMPRLGVERLAPASVACSASPPVTNRFIADADADERCRRSRAAISRGLLAHAHAASVFTTPTINGYKRFRPLLARSRPDALGRGQQGRDGAPIGGPGDPATRLENRSGEPAANPYLYIASQLVSGLDGIDRGSTPDRRR